MTRAPAARARQRGFFDFSMGEVGITFALALVVLGPKKLPGVVQQVGRWVGRARHMARQFREQLEQEVNSINAVKPVPRHVPPEVVGPPAPGTPGADGTAAAPDSPGATASPETAGVVDPVMPDATGAHGAAESSAADAAAAIGETHPEAQIYFALNGTQPEVVAQDPYAPPVAADDPQALAEPAAPEAAAGAPAQIDAGGSTAAVNTEKPASPASVEVVFPHDHG